MLRKDRKMAVKESVQEATGVCRRDSNLARNEPLSDIERSGRGRWRQVFEAWGSTCTNLRRQ